MTENPYNSPDSGSGVAASNSNERLKSVEDPTRKKMTAILNWTSVVSFPVFLLTLFIALGFALGPLRTNYDSPVRGIFGRLAFVLLLAGPIVTAFMIWKNLQEFKIIWIIPQALSAMGWAIIAYCIVGGWMGIH